MREEWKIKCIPGEVRTNQEAGKKSNKIEKEHVIRHEQSRIQQYAKLGKERAEYIHAMGQEITEHDISKAINKLNNRKSLGKDEITAEIIKENKEWIIPLTKKCITEVQSTTQRPRHGWKE